MKIKLWGVRGSLPTPLFPEDIRDRARTLILESIQRGCKTLSDVDQFLQGKPVAQLGGFGGNTSCVEVRTDRGGVIIDAGSGIRAYGQELLSGPLGKGKGEVHIFFTHFHWDHLIGLMFFVPIFIPGNKIHFYAVQPETEHVIRTLFRKPNFPVPYENLGATLIYHKLEPRLPINLFDLQLTPYQLDHPDPCWGFKIQHRNKVFSYCVDTECTRTSVEALGPDLPLYQGVDVMVFDAQYTILEAAERINWGHAAASFGLDLAMREGVKKVYFVHHDPAASDQRVGEAEQQTRGYYLAHLKAERASGRKVCEVEWSFAQEGQVISLE